MSMRKNLAVVVLLALALVCVFAACDTTANVTSIEISGINATYTVGDTFDAAKAQVTVFFDDETSKTYSVEEVVKAHSAKVINPDLTKVGTTSFVVAIGDISAKVDIVVEEPVMEVETFTQPAFLTSYENGTDANGKFLKKDAIYEVGNANGFILEPAITGFVGDERKTVTNGVKTVATLKKATGETTYEEVELADYATKTGNCYQFNQEAQGVFVLAVALDMTEYDIAGTNVDTDFEIKFQIVDGGYNVYDQEGLSVMNDAANLAYWADIWGVTVNGTTMSAKDDGTQPLQLAADSKPLYEYVGNVSAIVLHGNITIDADKLPAQFFWNGTEPEFDSAKDSLADTDPTLNMKEELVGSLRDGLNNGVSGRFYNSIYQYMDNANNNKGLYTTVKVSVSGNYNTITIPKERSAGGRLLKTVVDEGKANGVTVVNEDTPLSYWYLFRLFEDVADKSQGSFAGNPTTQYYVKNIGMTGNTGLAENKGPQGIGMINAYAQKLTVENIVANGFCTNLAHDNCNTSGTQPQIDILDSEIYDTYNAMAVTWRGSVTIRRSKLHDAGGPLFIISDGNNRSGEDDLPDGPGIPVLDVNTDSVLTSFATGSEPWYRDQGAQALMLAVQAIDANLAQISGKTMVTERTVNGSKNKYISIIALILPEAAAIPGDSSFNYKVPRGNFNVTDGDTTTSVFSMHDETLANWIQMAATPGINDYIKHSFMIQSGGNYAVVNDPDALTVTSPHLAIKQVLAGAGMGDAPTQQEMAAWPAGWKASTSEYIGLWTQFTPGVATMPYLGVVLSNYHTVE